MQVEQCIIVEQDDLSFAITSRVWLACELTGVADGAFVEVRLLEAGAGLAVGATLFIHSSKVRDS